MKEKNDYGFYSGGYIFDRLDRAALRFVRQAYPELKGKYSTVDLNIISQEEYEAYLKDRLEK